MKMNKEVYQVKIKKDYSRKIRLKKRVKRNTPRKYSRIIDEVNSIKQGLKFISIIELIYSEGQYRLEGIRR